MSFESLFSENNSLTHRRKVYTQTIFNAMVSQAAADLKSGLETREVIVPALARVIASSVPQTGQGHAERVAQMVNDQVDAALGVVTGEQEQQEEV
jgi:hypothetical protein